MSATSWNLRRAFALAAVGIALFAGCGGEQPPLVPVSGSVTYRGKPVPNVVVNFIPVNGRTGQALTDADGNFPFVQYTRERRGLLIEEYRIVVTYLPPEPPPGQPVPIEPPAPPEEMRPLLAKYGDFQKPQITEKITADTRELKLDLAD